MTAQTLSVDGWWRVVVLYDVWPSNLNEVARLLSIMGAGNDIISEATYNLSGWNAGVTYTAFGHRTSLVCIGRTDNLRQFLNTVVHEEDHVQDHICKYYDVPLGTEAAAYLQGYLGGRLFEFVIRKLFEEESTLDVVVPGRAA